MRTLLENIFKKQGVQADPSQFITYCDMLLETNKVMNLTAITEPTEVCIRHFADSVSLLSTYDFKNKKVIDVGCGAGFPGLPIRLAEAGVRLTLLDSLAKRIDFLSGVCQELGISDVECLHARAEEQAMLPGYRESYDIAVSRAVADLSMLCELTLPFVKVGGVLIAMKAKDCDEEYARAENAVRTLGAELEKRVDYPLFDTGITHTALIFRKTTPTPEKYPRRFAKIKSSPL